MKKAFKSWYVRGVCIYVVVLIVSMLLGFQFTKLRVEAPKGFISIQAQVALAASLGGTNGLGEPIPQEIVPPTFGRGGLPIVSVQYAETGQFLAVTMNGYPSIILNISDVPSWADLQTTENYINGLIKRSLEIWTPLNSFPREDPVRNEILLDNERIETSGRDYLVTTVGYGAIHIFSLSPFKFTTRFNGLDAGTITGEWWK